MTIQRRSRVKGDFHARFWSGGGGSNSLANRNTDQNEGTPPSFVETKNYRRFGEMCDACRRARVVGLGYGPPGTGKTQSAKQYAQWSLFKPFLPEPLITFTGRSAVDDLYPYRPLTFASAPLDTSLQQCRTVFYTPPVSASVARIEKQVLTLFAAFSYLVEAANQQHQGTEEFLVTRRYTPLIELLIVDEANRLKDAGLELVRDFADRGELGLVLLGMRRTLRSVSHVPHSSTHALDLITRWSPFLTTRRVFFWISAGVIVCLPIPTILPIKRPLPPSFASLGAIFA